jgi:hypothetical protein
MKIRIIARNENGEKAIQQHYVESMKVGRAKRMMMRQLGMRQEITRLQPYTLEVSISEKLSVFMKNKHITEEINEAMLKNGATLEDDYRIEYL